MCRLAGTALVAQAATEKRDDELIVHALQMIRHKADSFMNDINWEAEKVGCNYKEAVLGGAA